jgi:hypothetical protein
MTNTTITLQTPIKIDGEMITSLTMREPTVADQLSVSRYKGNDAEKEIFLLGNLCNLVPHDFEQMTMRDYKKIQQAWLDFLD